MVTGAGAGLGRLYALQLGARGAKVVVNDLGKDKETCVTPRLATHRCSRPAGPAAGSRGPAARELPIALEFF